MHAASQQPVSAQGTMQPLERTTPRPHLALVDVCASLPPMTTPSPSPSPPPRQFYIQGITADGRAFRPSDWAERLAGAMASFRPGGSAGGIASFIGYSPYCVPQLHEGVKSVLVNEALRGIEPMAWDFVMNFARDNGLKVVEVSGGSK
jgi:hypothetical protein